MALMRFLDPKFSGGESKLGFSGSTTPLWGSNPMGAPQAPMGGWPQQAPDQPWTINGQQIQQRLQAAYGGAGSPITNGMFGAGSPSAAAYGGAIAPMGSGEYSGVSGYSGGDRDEEFAPRDTAAQRPAILQHYLSSGVDPSIANEYLDLWEKVQGGTASPEDTARFEALRASNPNLTDQHRDDGWMRNVALASMLAAGGAAFAGAGAGAGAAGTGAGTGAATGGSLMGTGALGSGFSGAGLGAGTLGAEAVGGLGAMGGGLGAGTGAGLAASQFAGSAGSPLATGAGALPEWATTSGVGGAGTGMVSGVTGGAAGAAAPAGSAISRIIDGTATTQDWVSVLGSAGATGLGMFSSNRQGNALQDLANQSRADRAPFLNQATNWMNNPEAYWAGPGQASLNANLAQLGATYGNPISSPTALGIASGAGLRDWRDAVTGMANLGLSGEDTRARLGMGSAQADADMWSTLGGGISDIINPRTSLADMMKNYGLVIGGSRT